MTRRRGMHGPMILCLLALTMATEARSWAAPQSSNPPARAPYRIRPNDVLRIEVYGEMELSSTTRVQPDGKISSPLIQDLSAEGLTPGELSDVIEERLRQFLMTPTVTVIVESIESYRIFVTGLVQQPGVYMSPTPITVLQAIAMAGGLAQYADRNDIRIVRSRPGRDDLIYRFRYDEAIRGTAPGENILLESEDLIVVTD